MHIQDTLARLRISLSIAWIISVFACLVISWVFVGRALQPVNMMTRDALKISSSGELKRRIKEFGDKDEFGELSRALNRMLSSLEASYNSQKNFLADASHELRTPLTSIKANLDYIKRAVSDPLEEKAAALEDVISETNRMAYLVNELLMLSRAEGAVVAQDEQVDLVNILREVSARFQISLNESDSSTQLTSKNRSSLYINGDPEKIRQAMVILLDNAFKYSGNDAKVQLKIVQEGENVLVMISDNGPGIPCEELPLVFERFYRASNTRDQLPGTGLGLSIIKSIVQSHNGKIELSNNVEGGLSVKLLFPIAKSFT